MVLNERVCYELCDSIQKEGAHVETLVPAAITRNTKASTAGLDGTTKVLLSIVGSLNRGFRLVKAIFQ